MRTVRLLLPLVTVAGVLALAPAIATAQPYPAGSPAAEVSSGTVVSGGSIILSGQHFAAGEKISIDVTFLGGPTGAARHTALVPVAFTRSTTLVPVAFTLPRTVVKEVRADADGSFSTSVQLDGVGTAVITATGEQSGVTVSVTVTVLPRGHALPVTGDNGSTLRLILAGAAAVLIGALIVAITLVRRRGRTDHTAA
jgi:hypothetical protein